MPADKDGLVIKKNPEPLTSGLKEMIAIEPKKKKEVLYKNPKVKIGKGKLGPVDLIIYKDNLYALKRVPKREIDKPKRI